MKKYKLQSLISNGSHSRLKVDSDVLVGDIKNGFGYGDVLDANATKTMVSNIADRKIESAKQELIEMIREVGTGSGEDYTEVLRVLEQIQAKNDEQDEKDIQIIEQIYKMTPTVGGDNDNLIFA